MSASVTARTSAAGSDFAALNRQIVNAGLLERRPAYYAVRASVVTAALVGAWAAFFVIGSSWWIGLRRLQPFPYPRCFHEARGE